MIQSFFIYSILILVMVFLGINSAQNQAICLNKDSSFWKKDIIAALLLFAIISGIRYDVGVDYFTYLELYRSLSDITKGSHLEVEPGFTWVLNRFTDLGAHFSWMFGFFALMQIFFIYYAFKDERYLYPFLSFVIISSGIYFTMMNEIRQSIVWCILILAVRFGGKNDIWKYFALTFFGFLFHSSALLLIPLYLIIRSEVDFFKNTWLQLSLVLIAILFVNSNFWNYIMYQIEFALSLLNYDEKYGDITSRLSIWEKDYSKGIRFYVPVLINVCIILYSKKLKQYFLNTSFLKYYNLYFIGVLLSILLYNNVLMQRPARYFTSIQLVISSYMFFYLWKKRKDYGVSFAMFYAFIVLHLSILFAYVLSNHHTVYNFFWEY